MAVFTTSWLGATEHPKKDSAPRSRSNSVTHARTSSHYLAARATPEPSHARRRSNVYELDPRRSRVRRIRLPLFVACGTLIVVVWIIFSTTAGSDATQAGTARLRNSLSRPLARRKDSHAVISAKESSFMPSSDPLPVHHLEEKMIYHNYPLSKHRPPPNQFLLSPNAKFDLPAVAIITATNNPRRGPLLETAASLFGQSFQNFLWIIVSDHSDSVESKKLLAEVAKDPRVVVLKNLGFQGLSQGRNVALEHIFEMKEMPRYFIPLDDDDLFEFTALEKLIWMMESNEEWSLGGFHYVKWGDGANETVTTGLHSGKENWTYGNFVPNSAIVRVRDVLETGCRYDEVAFSKGGEDWDFWLCLAESGHWGGTAAEILYWYRANPLSFREKRWGDTFKPGGSFTDLRQRIQDKYPSLGEHFPVRFPQKSELLELISWDSPFESNLAATDKSIMFIVPWLYLGGADFGALHMIQTYAEAGYRVTVVCTLYKPPDGIELRPEVMQWTHDIHVLPIILRANDFPRYIKHLIESRGIKDVIFSNSMLIYEMLPALTEQMPHVKFIDYLHNEAYDGWKSGGYPQYSIINQRYIARTLTCSKYLKDWLHERGHLDASRVGVVKLGFDKTEFKAVTQTERKLAKAKLLQLEPSTVVITFVGRFDPQKRPTLIPLIAEELLENVGEDFIIFMIGAGPLLPEVRRTIISQKLHDFVRVLGAKSNVQDYLKATDIFLLPSVSEGISIAVAEAMAMALPVVTSNAGALPEQLGMSSDHHLGGVLVEHTMDDEEDARLYANELAALIRDAPGRWALGEQAREIVEDEPDWRQTMRQLFKETQIAKNLEGHSSGPSDYPHPSAYTAIQTLLLEDWTTTDMAAFYPGFVDQ